MSMKPIKASRPRFLRGTFASGILQRKRERDRKREESSALKNENGIRALSLSLSLSLLGWRIFEPGFINSRIRRETSRPIRDPSSRNKLDKYGETMRFGLLELEKVEINDENFSKLIRCGGLGNFNF